MIDISFPDIDWLLIRQALSLALLRNQPITIAGGPAFLRDHGDYLPLFDDMDRAVTSMDTGRLTVDGESILYEPKPLLPGKFRFETGHFSSTMEILLFMMPALFYNDFRTILELSGVTHSPLSCPTAFVKETLLTAMERLGFYGSLTLKRFGFYGSGGGAMESRIYPREKGAEWALPACGEASLAGAKIFISHLDTGLAELEKSMLMERLGLAENKIAIIEVMESDGPGNSLLVFADCGGLPVVLYRDMKMYGENGDIIFSEEALRSEITGIETEANALKNGVLPERVIRELCAYFILSGNEYDHTGESSRIAMTTRLCKKFS
jgi:RNA 3'-terminal phosphate cyclase